MEPEIELTILMPCLNEANTLGRCIDKAAGYLSRSGLHGEILIADNGSQAIAAAHGARLVNVPERSYRDNDFLSVGEAVRGQFPVLPE